MRVRADRPGYFLGMTYDTWDGQNWKRSPTTSRFTDAEHRIALRRRLGPELVPPASRSAERRHRPGPDR